MNAYPTQPALQSSDRVRRAWQARHESDYLFSFWTAIGWTLLTLGIYGLYVFYQLMRRMRDHNRRRLELLEAANQFAWEQASARGLGEELRPNFERVAGGLAHLQGIASDFREPAVWTVLALVASGLVHVIAYVLIDSDLVRHDDAEVAIENELAVIYGRLGCPLPWADSARVKDRHNWFGRVVATVVSCGLYLLWWTADVMREGNDHFEGNWEFEDAVAGAVQTLSPAA